MSAPNFSGIDGLPMRRGVSALEFLGVFAALAGGVAIGSVYLGLDLKVAAQRLLQRTTAPAIAETAATVVDHAEAPAANTIAPNAFAEAPKEQASLSDAAAKPAAAPRPALPFAGAIELTEEQRREVTRAYWEALNGFMKTEAANRTVGLKANGDWELYNYLQARSEGHRAAASSISQLETSGVDSHVAAYGEKALAWHEEGAKLYARAKDLLTDAPTAQLSGPFAQSWQSAATQHQMEERLLAEKLSAVQSYLDHEGPPTGGDAHVSR